MVQNEFSGKTAEYQKISTNVTLIESHEDDKLSRRLPTGTMSQNDEVFSYVLIWKRLNGEKWTARVIVWRAFINLAHSESTGCGKWDLITNIFPKWQPDIPVSWFLH